MRTMSVSVSVPRNDTKNFQRLLTVAHPKNETDDRNLFNLNRFRKRYTERRAAPSLFS